MGADYIEVNFICKPFNESEMDILSAFLCDFGYDSFVTTEDGLKAYINSSEFEKGNIDSVLSMYEFESAITWSIAEIKGDNWNKEWEQNSFQPIVIGDQCVVHATYHDDFPRCQYEVLIDPKMSFGSGHHETTSMMIEALLKTNLKGKAVIDMGAGTGILSIMAAKLGAKSIVGVEIDEGAWENSKFNAQLNSVDVLMLLGDASCLHSCEKCDIFLANINRNILMNDIDKYVSSMNNGGKLFVSGFFESDLPLLISVFAEFNLDFVNKTVRNEWTMAEFVLK